MPAKARKSPDPGDSQQEFIKVDKNLYRRQPTGQYYGFLKRGGKKFKRSLKTRDRKLAERRLAKLKKEVANLSLTEDSDITFENLAKRWLETVKHSLKTSTIKRRLLSIRQLSPFFGGTPVRKISSRQSENWVIKRGKSKAASTFHQELDTMRMIFNFAVEKGLMLTNPAAGIKRRKVTKKEMIIPTRDQLKSLVNAIRESDGRVDSQRKAKAGADMVEFLAYSGCRIGEAREVLWRHVDFDKGVLWVHGGEEGTKNHEIRKIPLSADLRILLMKMRDDSTAKPGDKVHSIRDAKKCIETACRRLGYHKFSHHDFRHLFATHCIESGVDIPTISHWLGHNDGGALCMKTYGHLRDEHSKKAMEKVKF